MRRSPRTIALVGAATLALALTGCGSRPADGQDVLPSRFEPSTTEVELRYTDSSVPPEYHRSYLLTVRQGAVHVVVDSYGDVLHDVTKTVPLAQWRAFVRDLPGTLGDLPMRGEAESGCTGGTTSELTVTETGERTFHALVENCSSDGNAAVATGLDELLAPFARLVDLERLTRAD